MRTKRSGNEHNQLQFETPILVLANSSASHLWRLVRTPELCLLGLGLRRLVRPSFIRMATQGGRHQGTFLLVGVNSPDSDGDHRDHHTHPTYQVRDPTGRLERGNPVCFGGGAGCLFNLHRGLRTVGSRTLPEVGRRAEDITPASTTDEAYGAGGNLLLRYTGDSNSRSFVPFNGGILAEYYCGGMIFDHPDEIGSLTTATAGWRRASPALRSKHESSEPVHAQNRRIVQIIESEA